MTENSGAARAELLSSRRAALLAEARKRFAQMADTSDPAVLKIEIAKLLRRASLGYETLDPSGRSTAASIHNSIDTIVALHGAQDPGDPTARPMLPVPLGGQPQRIRHTAGYYTIRLALCAGVALIGMGLLIGSEYPDLMQSLLEYVQRMTAG